jgi:hypothetical protein
MEVVLGRLAELDSSHQTFGRATDSICEPVEVIRNQLRQGLYRPDGKDHTDDLAAFQKEEAATQNQKLKRAVAKAIPIIHVHLNMAKSDSTNLAAR